MNKQGLNKEKLLNYLLIVSIVAVSLVGLYVLQLLTKAFILKLFQAINAVLIPFVIAFFLSFIIGPLARVIHDKLKIHRSLSIVIAILIGILFILAIIGVAIYFIVSQMTAILNSLMMYVDNVSIKQFMSDVILQVTTFITNSELSELIYQISQNGASIALLFAFAGSLIVSLAGFASSILGVMMVFILTPVFMFYLIKEKELIFLSLSKVAPKKVRPHVIELGKRSDAVIRHYFKGQGIMMFLIFVFFAITLSVLSFFVPNFPIYYALIFAVLMGLFNIIPYIGAWLGVLAPMIFLLTRHLEYNMTSDGNIYLIAMLIVLGLQIIEQVLESSVVQPQVLGKQVHIHPLAILSALLFFGGVFGFAGVLLAVPLTGTIKASLDYFDELNREAEQKEEQEKMILQTDKKNDKKQETPKKKSFLSKKPKE